MRSIQQLPESVHSSVRSGINMSDLTRVVEELIFNSLDAGAAKVYVAVGVGTCYAKVVDNGSGITRDGLVLLGERYATSKLDQPDGIDAVTGDFGCRGEALSSISDVSLLEIVTKSHGRPNGYRKVIKGCKCMYLGIDDNKQDVGTTVIVRDLFYNQPVRRKHMHSSPKKVLHSVKKCVLRIALVHPKVLFKVVDTESEDELLCTYPSRSPLSLLTSDFGLEVSNTLHELNVSDGALKLSGYLSAPCDTFSVKAFQYIYINSRYICKGPLHKLLNQLATKFNSASIWKANIGSENGKRSRSQTYATYVLNLSCPRSCYALTFEPSKPSVEFKDWAPILNFIEESVTHFWSKNTSYGDSLSHAIDMSTKENMWKEGDNTVSSREAALPAKHEVAEKRRRFSGWKAQRKTSEFKDHHTSGFGFAYDDDYPYQSCDVPFVQFRMTVDPEDNIFGNKLSATENSSVVVDNILDCILKDGRLNAGNQSFDDHKVVDAGNQNFDFIPRSLWQEKTASAWSSPIHGIKSNLHRGLDLLSRDSIKSSSIGGKCFDDENDLLPPDSLTGIGEFGSRHQSFDSEWSSVMPDPLFEIETPDLDNFTHENALERLGTHFDSVKHDTLPNSSRRGNWSLSLCTNVCSDYKVDAGFGEDISEFLEGPKLDDVLFSRSSDPCNDEIGKLHLGSPRENFVNQFAAPCYHNPAAVYLEKDVNLMDRQIYQEENYLCKKGSIRSHSAPPFYKGRKKFFVLNNHVTTKEGKPNAQIFDDAHTLGETGELNHPQTSYPISHLPSEASFGKDTLFDIRQDMTQDALEIEGCEMTKKSKGLEISNTKSVEDFTSNEQITKDFMSREIQDPLDSGLKWRNNRPQIANGNITQSHCSEDSILDISSGLLHLAGGESLVPKSVNKKLLEDAKILQQVDKKFIPVVAGGVLALIDQHAADERIRLEELRHKVLCGEMKTITYLDAEQELVLPEIGNQLLHSYAEQIQSWGWICNIHTQASRSFKKNLNLLHKHRSVVTLLAVPCILGVNLTDVDLLEFLQQLSDTDGSSTMPPSVLRVLNFKACRGAIMFGDTLLPSECSLIVEELKQTSLCFQCAHGRPTTAPLVNLGVLHKQIAKLGLLGGGSNEPWHGLHRHELSLERAAMRLTSSGGPC